jgi:hypothetical protein
MSDYSISKDGDQWAIQKHGASKRSGYAGTKEEARQRAAELATNSGGGEVREHASRDGSVHKKGQIIDSDTHGKIDPPSKG